jgi:uncharacterized protein (UPF0548 family)
MREVRLLSPEESARLRQEPFSYAPVGATQGSSYPSGYAHLDERFEIGRGQETYEHAVETLMTWRMHAGAGLRVRASTPRVAVGEVVMCRLGPLPVPCRVVWVDERTDACGFGYGSLPGHPEAGEESFEVRIEKDLVTLSVSAYSRPATLLTRLAGPVGRWGQRFVIGRYADALRR